MTKKVNTAYLIHSLFIPGVGSLGTTLPPSNKTIKDFDMTLEENGSLTLNFEYAGFGQQFTVAAANLMGVYHPRVSKAKAA